MNIRVYIDGFNLYYGALKDRPEYKWLDLVKLSQRTARAFFPQNDYNIDFVRYFTSLVKGRAKGRQKTYIDALKALPENQDKIEIHYGSFRYRPFTAKLVNIPIANKDVIMPNNHAGDSGQMIRLPIGDYLVRTPTEDGLVRDRILPVRSEMQDQGYRYIPKTVSVKASKPEEKRTDVNIACHLLNDAWKDLFDVAIIISNDSDLVAPIDIVINECRKSVYVISPQIGRGVVDDLNECATNARHMRTRMLRGCLLPDRIPGTNIRRPREWY